MEWRETSAGLERARDEQALWMPGPHGALSAILTPPAPAAPAAGLCVLMPTRTRWRPGRMPVKAARSLAARGFICVRLDCHGHGQSAGEAPISGRDYVSGEDVVAAIRHLREHLGFRRFVIAGYCSDALAGLAAFAAEGDAIIAFVSLAAPVLRVPESGWDQKYVLDAIRDRDKLRRYLKFPRGWTGKLASAGRALARSALGTTNRCPARFAAGFEFQALVRSGARALFIFGREDLYYWEFQSVAHELLAPLSPRSRRLIEVEVWPGRAQVAGDVRLEQALYERAIKWIAALHAALDDRFTAIEDRSAAASAPAASEPR